MDEDCRQAYAKFIDESSDVREDFHFANPLEQVRLIEALYCDSYEAMIWDLQSEATEKYFRAWNTNIKLAWDIPRSTQLT